MKLNEAKQQMPAAQETDKTDEDSMDKLPTRY